jgi:formyltetrahydrofolate-dependent phosphoribosylglycinamide formyltransferase
MRAVIEACQSGKLDAEVACVIAPREDAPAVGAARQLRVDVVVPIELNQDLLWILHNRNIDLVCLAGYMRLIPQDVVRAYKGRMLNIHPALLPKYGGKGMWGPAVHQAVIDAGERESGCTVHFVSEKYDEGEILLQQKCKVEPDDSAESLAARVLQLEHECYVQAIRRWIEIQT